MPVFSCYDGIRRINSNYGEQVRNNDMNVPWQFVVLGFWLMLAIPSVYPLAASFQEDSGMRPWTRRWFQIIGIPFYAAGIGAAPWLIRNGTRRMKQINTVKVTQGKVRVAPAAMSPSKRMAVSAITFCAGVVMTLASYGQATPGGTFYVYYGLMIIGLSGFVAGAMAEK